MHDDITAAEACAILCINEDALRVMMCRPGDDNLPERFTTRQLLAARVFMATLALCNTETATRTGITAGQGAREGGNRMLVVAYPDGQDPEAFWRDAGLNIAINVPGLVVPADAWFDAMDALVRNHRRASARPN